MRWRITVANAHASPIPFHTEARKDDRPPQRERRPLSMRGELNDMTAGSPLKVAPLKARSAARA